MAERLWEKKYGNGVGAMAVRPTDGRLLVLGLWDNPIVLVDAHTGSHVAALHLHPAAIAAVTVLDAPTGLALHGRGGGGRRAGPVSTGFAVASRDNTVSLWDLRLGL